MKMTNSQKAAVKIFYSHKLEGISLRDRYLPKICYKCGKSLEGFTRQTNGFYHCAICSLPITKSPLEIIKEIFKHLVKNIKADGENTIQHILLDDEV